MVSQGLICCEDKNAREKTSVSTRPRDVEQTRAGPTCSVLGSRHHLLSLRGGGDIAGRGGVARRQVTHLASCFPARSCPMQAK